MLIVIFAVVLYLAACAGVGIIGEKRSIGGGISFFLSIILTPLFGLIITAMSNKPTPVIINNKKEINLNDELKEIVKLRDSGVLSEVEFAQAKAKILS